MAVCQDESIKESAGRGTCRASLLGLNVRSSSCLMGESPPRRLSGVCGGPVPAGDDMAPVLVGAPAELALMRIAAVFTEALGLEVSCSSCACSREIPDCVVPCLCQQDARPSSKLLQCSLMPPSQAAGGEAACFLVCLTTMLISRRWACHRASPAIPSIYSIQGHPERVPSSNKGRPLPQGAS